MEIYNLDLEQYLISGILRNPEVFPEIDGYISETDFHSPLHQTIFSIIRQTFENQQKLDKVLIAEKIQRISLSFDDKISSVFDYLEEITSKQINASSIRQTAEELKIFSLRREFAHTGEDISRAMYKYPNATSNELISIADEIYNKKIALWSSLEKDEPENLFTGLDITLEELKNQPIESVGLLGPHNMINRLYGSLIRPGNITTICSRSGSGKTTFMNDFCLKVSETHDIPILHFDNGEMSKEELQMRMVAAISGVSLYQIETGKYGNDPERVFRIKEAWKRVKNLKFYYYNVAGKPVEEMLSILRRFYISKIGRGKNMLFCFDYIKSTSEVTSLTKAEWESIGRMVTKFKDFISKEIKIPMLTAVQSNRIGIVTSKDSKFVIDDESIFSGGDRTVFFSSHAFILRRKTYDEFESENGKFGTHKLINVKPRHLGEEVGRALNLVSMPDGKKRNNFINLHIDNFSVEEKGDLVDMVRQIGNLDIADHTKVDLF